MGWCTLFKENIQQGNLTINREKNKWEFKGEMIDYCPFCDAMLTTYYDPINGQIEDKEGNIYK